MPCVQTSSVFRCDAKEVFELTYDSDGEFGCGDIIVTGNHPIWVQGKGWVAAQDLKAKDVFLTHDDVHAELMFMKKLAYPLPVYSLEVEDFHTYFVASEGIWVHNQN